MNEAEKIDALMAIFRCSSASAKDLAAIFRPQSVAARGTLADQGENADCCWIVITGSIRVHAMGTEGQEQQLAQHGPGEFFGAFPEESIHRATISALHPSKLLKAQSTSLTDVVSRHTDLAYGMARILARQLDRALDRMVIRATHSAAGRVYAELLELAGDGNAITPPPRVTNLALAANTTRETASRAIGLLIRRGVISRNDECLTINSPRILRELIY